jgi:teichuronic acid biosynthesis glycosyltransferase TuaG
VAPIREASLTENSASFPDNDRVLVVMPAHNAAKTIRGSIASVLGQSHADWRLLVADDASSDATFEIAQAFARQDHRIECLKNTGPRGVASARNTALRCGRSERWIAFLDSDDLWHPDKLRLQIDLLRQQKAVLCFASYWRISENGFLASSPVRVPSQLTLAQLLGNTAIATSTVVIDSSQQRGFLMNDGVSYEDFDLWTRLLDGRDDFQRRTSLLSAGRVAIGLQQPVMAYRICAGSVSRKRVRMSRWVWRIMRSQMRLPFLYASLKFVEYAVRAWLKHARYRPQRSSDAVLPPEVLALVRGGALHADSDAVRADRCCNMTSTRGGALDGSH